MLQYNKKRVEASEQMLCTPVTIVDNVHKILNRIPYKKISCYNICVKTVTAIVVVTMLGVGFLLPLLSYAFFAEALGNTDTSFGSTLDSAVSSMQQVASYAFKQAGHAYRQAGRAIATTQTALQASFANRLDTITKQILNAKIKMTNAKSMAKIQMSKTKQTIQNVQHSMSAAWQSLNVGRNAIYHSLGALLTFDHNPSPPPLTIRGGDDSQTLPVNVRGTEGVTELVRRNAEPKKIAIVPDNEREREIHPAL